MKILKITKTDKTLKGTIRLPNSKSISNRLLIIRAMAEESFAVHNLSDSGDTAMLERLLVQISKVKDPSSLTEIDAGDAGTVMRFLVAYLSMVPGKWVLTGTKRMKERPIGVLVDGLKPLGADIEYLAKLGFPPVLIKGRKLHGGEIVIDPGISSQFISALIMIGPTLPGGLRIHIAGHPVSQPYIDMTLRLLQDFGVEVRKERSFLVIPEAWYRPAGYDVEADWSSAAFWYEAAALSDEVDLVLEGLHKNSIQGDSVVAEIYEQLGVHTEFIEKGIRLTRKHVSVKDFCYTFTDHPDIAPAVITTCAALGMRCSFDGIGTLRIKESDRVMGLYQEFRRMGIRVNPLSEEAGANPVLVIEPSVPHPEENLVLKTYDDHRMAMTFAPLSVILGNILIENPGVVVKSYPEFWKNMTDLGFLLSEV